MNENDGHTQKKAQIEYYRIFYKKKIFSMRENDAIAIWQLLK